MEEEFNHANDVDRTIRSVLSEHIVEKPSKLETISKYYFNGEVGLNFFQSHYLEFKTQ